MKKNQQMKSFFKTASIAIALGISTNANSALVERLGGLAYYDTEADLTWLADTIAGKASVYDDGFYPNDGRMTWDSANSWAASLNVAGVTGWRLPDSLQPDPSCSDQHSSGISWGSNCTGSEMGNLFYNVLGNTVGYLSNAGPFRYIADNAYWSSTEYVFDTGQAIAFHMHDGIQSSNQNKSKEFNAWAVHSGDVNPVPIPAAAWLFGSGLVGLAGIARRKKNLNT